MPETIGQLLKKARLLRNLSIDEVAKATHIRPLYLEAIEADNFSAFSSSAQGKGFVNNYGDFLQINLNNISSLQDNSKISNSERTIPLEDTPSKIDRSKSRKLKDEFSQNSKTAVTSPTNQKEVAERAEISPRKEIPSNSPRKRVKTTANKPNSQRENALKKNKTQKSKTVNKSSRARKNISKEFASSTVKQDISGPGNLPINQDANIDQYTNSLPDTKSTPENSIPIRATVTELGQLNTSDSKPDHVNTQNNYHESQGEKPSKQIFFEIGSLLKRRREILGMSIDEIEHHIHVRGHYIQSVELGDFDKLPSSVQARGMIQNYARFLDMDVDSLLLNYADGLQARLRERNNINRSNKEKTFVSRNNNGVNFNSIRKYLSIDILVGGGLIILLIVFAIWGVGRIIDLRHIPASQPTAPSISDVLLTSPTPVAQLTTTSSVESLITSTALNATQILPTDSTSSVGRVHIIAIAVERAYVVVTVDGNVKFDGRVIPGIAYPFDGNDRIEILTGNGAAIKIIYNNVDMGPMGTFGQVVDLIFTSGTVMTPTTTPTPTPTISPTPTKTLIPSPTPRFSPTPSRTPTPTP